MGVPFSSDGENNIEGMYFQAYPILTTLGFCNLRLESTKKLLTVELFGKGN